MENGNAGVSCPIPLSQPAEKSKHTKTSRKSFKALPEAVTGAPAFGFREVFLRVRECNDSYRYQSLCSSPFLPWEEKRAGAGGKGMASGSHPFPFIRNLWSLCISPCSVYNNNDKE